MINAKNITKTFGEVRSLNDVSVSVDGSSIMGLIGSNGSGKSTLLRILAGIYTPDSGEVTVDGYPIFENAAVKSSIVYLSDEQYFLPGATIADMKTVYKSAYPKFNNEKYRRLLSVFELDENRRVSTFSKGMQKQASVLLGLSTSCRYILCDETFDGLDPVMRRLVKRLLADDMAEYGTVALIASHNLREIEDICDSITLLHQGELLLEAGLDDIKLGLHKVQAAFSDPAFDPDSSGLDILSSEKRGSLYTMILRGSREEAEAILGKYSPTFSEFIPLTLEEIFLAEMGGKGYDCSKIIF